jgi:hypothetical protein
MKKITLIIPIVLIAVMSLGFIGCADDDDPGEGNGTVAMSTELASGGTVKSQTFGGKSDPSGLFVDSLKVTYAAVVISNLKMHPAGSTDSTDDDGTIKTGPFLLVFDSTGAHVAVSSPVPAGTYDRIKFEIHKLRNGVDDSLRTLLSDFVTNDATFKFMGHVWVAGVQSEFTVYADNTENIQEFFDPSNVEIVENSTANVTLQFDPSMIFEQSGVVGVIDPRDISNKNVIKAGIKDAFKAMKK